MTKKNKGMYRVEIESFYTGEGSEKPKLSHSDFAADAEFDDAVDMSAVEDFLMCNDRHYSHAMTILVSGSSKTTARNANKLFSDIIDKFAKNYDTVDLFDIITTFYSLDATEYFNQLILEFRTMLLADISARCDLGWHARRHAADLDEE